MTHYLERLSFSGGGVRGGGCCPSYLSSWTVSSTHSVTLWSSKTHSSERQHRVPQEIIQTFTQPFLKVSEAQTQFDPDTHACEGLLIKREVGFSFPGTTSYHFLIVLWFFLDCLVGFNPYLIDMLETTLCLEMNLH